LEVGSREYEKARKDHNCVILDDGSVKAMKKIPRNYEVLLSGGDSEDDLRSTRSKVGCDGRRQSISKKARTDI
jgi:2-polyprenyl-6-methoxyphenol hydroxylase-like FAD-dependent oxidoreductase